MAMARARKRASASSPRALGARTAFKATSVKAVLEEFAPDTLRARRVGRVFGRGGRLRFGNVEIRAKQKAMLAQRLPDFFFSTLYFQSSIFRGVNRKRSR